MSASGMLRSDEVIFYHPLYYFNKHTQSQLQIMIGYAISLLEVS